MSFRIKLVYKDEERVYFDKSLVPKPYNKQKLLYAAVICEPNRAMADDRIADDSWFTMNNYEEAIFHRIRGEVQCDLYGYQLAGWKIKKEV